MNKEHFYYTGKTGIGRTKAFEKKLLAEYSVNIGNICEFGCSFCYVPSITRKQKTVRNVLDKGYELGEFSLYRERENVLDTIRKDLKRFDPEDESTVIFCTTCDPCATKEHTKTSIEAMKLILDESNLQIRVLSKSVLIKDIAKKLSLHKDRITYSLSTGTANEKISIAIEQNASTIKERVKALHWLQDHNYRTYGMVCPVLPSEIEQVRELLDQVNPKECEDVWVEAINVRGKSINNTYNRLKEADLDRHAEELKRVMGNKKEWVEYSKNLFLAFQSEMKERNQLEKLHFLQYVTRFDREFFKNKEGAVCL